MIELTPEAVLADLFTEPPYELADANGAAQAAVQRLEDAGFRILAPNATATVFSIAHRHRHCDSDHHLWAAYASAVLAVPPSRVAAATEALKMFARRASNEQMVPLLRRRP
jgi:hypothetical protein